MPVDLHLDPPVALIRLARPTALNALDEEMTASLERALDRVDGAAGVGAVVVAAQGYNFCAGTDVLELARLDPADAAALAARQARLLARLESSTRLTVGAIDGFTLGTGLMMALMTDLRVTTNRGRFGLPEISFGLTPLYGLARLSEVAGGAHARDLLLTGRLVDATEALRMGLVTRVVTPAGLEAAAVGLVSAILAHPAEGLLATKRLLASRAAGAVAPETVAFQASLRTEAVRARLSAFASRKGRR
jgi:enoyl-CoA hydratase/carnithine racemase